MTNHSIKILVPIDGSENSLRALNFALTLAKASGGRIELANAQPPVDSAAGMFLNKADIKGYHREEGMKALAAALAAAKSAGVAHGHHIGVGQPGEVIAAFAKELGCTQIIMGTRGLGSAMGLLMGSVATDVIHNAAVPVTLVK